jgi:glycine/D-amino acid oxidase-like deaminating enzyme
MAHITIVGGGIGGLTAAVAAREQGHDVTVHEAHDRLGGRAWTTEGERKANWGPHVVYSDGPLWRWLDERGLARPAATFPKLGKLTMRVDGTARRVPPAGVARGLLRLRSAEAPIDRSFTDWAREHVADDRTVAQVASFIGVATFHHDPGSLSAAFVVDRIRRTTAFPPTVRYIPGGWATLVARLAAHAAALGARIELSSPVDALPQDGPVIVAVPLRAASKLLGEDVSWTGARTALLDVAIAKARGDSFITADLDECGWAEAFSMADSTLAPRDEHLVQTQIGMRPDESLDEAITRAERLLDVGCAGWRERERWRRHAKIDGESGAVDPPGTSWRDRPAIDRGNGVYLVGDMVASPGLLAEVSHAAALTAVDAITNGERPGRQRHASGGRISIS